MRQPFHWLFLLLSICLNAGASLLLKLSTGSQGMSRLLIAGVSLTCYALGFFTFYMCLRSFPVSVAYPVMTGGSIVTIMLVAAVTLGEPLTGLKALGAVLVMLGGMLLVRQS